jgi:DNA (cytosine-5)-methyltransferase 1
MPDTAADRRFRRFLGKFGVFRPSPLLYNHTVRYHNPRDLELYRLLKPGEDSVHLLERHKRDDLMRYRKDVFDDKYARLRADRPSKTIVAHLAKDGNGYIHPDQPRSISLREAPRVQSFHDGFSASRCPTREGRCEIVFSDCGLGKASAHSQRSPTVKAARHTAGSSHFRNAEFGKITIS